MKKTIMMLMAVLAVIFCVKAASAATFDVGLEDDRLNTTPFPNCTTSSPCSLREAIVMANVNADQENIINVPAGDYLIEIPGGDDIAEKGDLDIIKSVTIIGDPNGGTKIINKWFDRVFEIHNKAGNVTLQNLDISEGNQMGGGGGGIRSVSTGTLTIINCGIHNNKARWGAGIHVVGGNINIVKSSIVGNVATRPAEKDGLTGGIRVDNSKTDGSITLDDVTIKDNQSDKEVGGANFDAKSNIDIKNSHIIGNKSIINGDSGGIRIYSSEGAITISKTEISGNENLGSWAAGLNAWADKKDVKLSEVKIMNNKSETGKSGGAFIGCGGVGSSSLDASIISGNTSKGTAGIYFTRCKKVSILNSTIDGNKPIAGLNTGGRGIFIASDVENAEILGSTISNNNILGDNFPGAGINAGSNDLSIVNSTLFSNSASDVGGGLFFAGTGEAKLTNVTVAKNSAAKGGGGIYAFTLVSLQNSIISGNTTNNCAFFNGVGSFKSIGNNISSDDTCFLTATGDMPKTDPKLGDLADNGGPTKTMALLEGSPAIDKGAEVSGLTTDQRGFPRPLDGDKNGTAVTDIGAFEFSTCGDGVVQTGEECDDANSVNEDACTNMCKNAVCGDGYIQSGEECDGGTECTAECKKVTSGVPPSGGDTTPKADSSSGGCSLIVR